MSELLFFISIAFIGYTYVGYFLIVVLRGTLFPRGVEKRYHQPPVSVVFVVGNDEISVRTRIENLRDQDYPAEQVEIVIVADGSTDRTVEIARDFGGDGIVVVELREPVGRSRAINMGVKQASHDIIVFADIRSHFSRNVIAELTANLWDKSVGAVSGQLVVEPSAGNELHGGLNMYWRYEKLLRRMESAAGSVVGATGSIYAIRRELYVPPAPRALLDDLLISMRIVMQGYRVLYVRSPRAFEISSRTSIEEFRESARSLAGGYQAMALEPRLIDPRSNPLFMEFVSHRVARLIVPYFFIISLLASGTANGAFYTVLFWLQVAFFGLGFLRYTPLRDSILGAPARISWTFTVLNAAAITALWMYVTGRERMVWRGADYDSDPTSPSR